MVPIPKAKRRTRLTARLSVIVTPLAFRSEHVSHFLDDDLRNRVELGHHGSGVETVVDLREQIGSGSCAHLPGESAALAGHLRGV